jgi:hypothetical protein
MAQIEGMTPAHTRGNQRSEDAIIEQGDQTLVIRHPVEVTAF